MTSRMELIKYVLISLAIELGTGYILRGLTDHALYYLINAVMYFGVLVLVCYSISDIDKPVTQFWTYALASSFAISGVICVLMYVSPSSSLYYYVWEHDLGWSNIYKSIEYAAIYFIIHDYYFSRKNPA